MMRFSRKGSERGKMWVPSGATKPAQIEENVKAIEVTLQPELYDEIERILKQVEGFEPLR